MSERRTRFHDGLDADLKAALLAQIRNLWTHTSTAIEGNSLTLGETDFVISEGLTIAGKPLKDHQEVHGHARAIEIVYALLDRPRIDVEDLFALHRAVLTEDIRDIFRPIGGWKRAPNSTNAIAPDGRQVIIEFPAPERTSALMDAWLDRFNARHPDTHNEAIAAYADSHLEFVTIHPFFDGNGRMARLLGNIPVLRAGLPPIVVPKEQRLQYLRGIAAYQLSIPGYPDVAEFPRNAERDAFTVLCRAFAGETLEHVEDARRRQRQRGRIDQGESP